MISGERQKPLQKAARWPCGVCGRGVGSNSIQCTRCHKCIHKKCSGIKARMDKVMRSFICRGCSNPVISTGHRSVLNILDSLLANKYQQRAWSRSSAELKSEKWRNVN